MHDTEAIKEKIAELTLEHRALDEAIERMAEGPFVDQFQLTRLKKRKLYLKDAIARLTSMLLPDMPA
jgi:hypothetical protein